MRWRTLIGCGGRGNHDLQLFRDNPDVKVAGVCDAYVEKPVSHNIREGRLLVEAGTNNRVHVQHGTQCRSTTMMMDAVKLLRDGVIGSVLVAKCWNIQRRGSIGRGQDSSPPAGFDDDSLAVR